MDKIVIVSLGYVAAFVIIILIAIYLIRKKRISDYRKEIDNLDKKKNEIESAPVVSELAKLETIVKNDKIPTWYKWVSFISAILVCVSTLTVKQHLFVDIIAGILLAEISYLIAKYIDNKTNCSKMLMNKI